MEPSVAPRARVVVVGDSHPTQFLAALRPLAAERGWGLVVMSRGGCLFSSDSEIVPGDRACGGWNAAALAEIVADLVFTATTRVWVGRTEVTPPGYVERWRLLDEAGIPVLAVRDSPRFDRRPPSAFACTDASRVGATPRAGISSARSLPTCGPLTSRPTCSF